MDRRTRGWSPFAASAAAAVLVLGAVPATADTAANSPAWEKPVQLMDRTDADYVDAVTTQRGLTVVKWELAASCAPLELSVRGANSPSWTRLSEPVIDRGSSTLLTAGRNRAVLVTTTCADDGITFQRVFRDRLGRTHEIASPTQVEAADAAINSVGGLVAIWDRHEGGSQVTNGAYWTKDAGWQDLPELHQDAVTLVRHVMLSDSGEVLVVGNCDAGICAHTLEDGEWTTQLLPDSDGFRDFKVVSSPSGHVTAMWLRIDGGYRVLTASRLPGKRFQQPETLTPDRSCAASWLCADLDIDADGDVTAIWPFGDLADGTYHLARRSAGTGEWSPPELLVDPHTLATPAVDVNARGDAMAWIDDSGQGRGMVWQCRLDQTCLAVPYRRHVEGEFMAGPRGSATAVFGQLVCDEECTVANLAGARLIP